MNRLMLPALLVLGLIGAGFLGLQPPAGPPATPSPANELEAAVPHLERVVEQFLTRVRGHNAPMPITEVEARRIEAMLAAMSLEVPRGTVQSGTTVTDAARAAVGRLTPAQLAQLPGLVPAAEGLRRELPIAPTRPGDEVERRSAELRLNGIPLDAERARIATIKPGDKLEAMGAVFYPVRIGSALVEFRDESRLTVRENELSLDEGQILVRTQETPSEASPAASPAPSASPSLASARPSPGAAPSPRAVASGSPAPGASPAPSAAPNLVGRFRVGTPHADMIDIGTAFVATAERRRSRCEVLLGKVYMRSKRTGGTVELDPGEFAWTDDDGNLVKKAATVMVPPTPSPSVPPGSPGPGASPGPSASPEILTEDATLISSGDLPKPTPTPPPTVIPQASPVSSPSPETSPSPSTSPPPVVTPAPNLDPLRNTPLLGGAVGTPAVTPTAPVTPTPAPVDTE